MEFDNYCIGLVVLVLFFLYIDNSLNLEGFSLLNDEESTTNDIIPKLVDNKEDVKLDKNVGVQDSEIIGARPKKLETKPLSSLEKNLKLLSNPNNLSSLDNYFKPVSTDIAIPKQVPTNLLNIQARFGGEDNLGTDKIGSVGSPVKPVGNSEVLGIPLLDNPSIGAPLNYGMDTKSLPNMVNDAPNMVNKAASKNLELHMVYTDWCGHSKRALPHFDKVMSELHGSTLGEHNVKVIKHDAETAEGKEFAKKHNVKGFPTHFIIEGEKKIEKGIGRTYDELMSKMKSITS